MWSASGPPEPFPTTRRTLVEALGNADRDARRAAWNSLVEAYWKPAYKYLRIRWSASPEDAEDWTQEFFGRAFEQSFLEAYDPDQARFRTYLRICLDRFTSNQRKASGRQKRGGGAYHLSLDFTQAEDEIEDLELATDADADRYFRQEWIRHLFAGAVEDLRRACEASGKSVYYEIFERYDLEAFGSPERLTYHDLAAEFDLPETKITNYLAFARRRFRQAVLDRLRDITGSDREFAAEASELLGIEPE